MGDTSVGYLHGDYPVAIDATFIKRVQNVNLNRDKSIRTVWELGNAQPAGLDDGPDTFTGDFSWFPVDIQVEQAFAGTSGTWPVAFAAYAEATAVTVQTLTKGVTGARLMSIEYSCQAEGEYRGTVRFEGTGWDSDGATTITATAPSGQGAYRSPDVFVEMNTTSGVRVQAINIRGNARSNRMYELSNSSPVGTIMDRPEVSMDVTWYESTSMAGETELTLSSPADCEVQIGVAGTWDTAGNIKHILKNMVTQGEAERGSVDGWAVLTQRYISKSDATYHGLQTSIIQA